MRISDWSSDVCSSDLSLMYGLIKNHPFHDANKRTAFLCAILHLQKIGRTPTIDQKSFEDFTVNVAEGNLDTYDGYNAINGSGSDKDILFMSKFRSEEHTSELQSLMRISYAVFC